LQTENYFRARRVPSGFYFFFEIYFELWGAVFAHRFAGPKFEAQSRTVFQTNSTPKPKTTETTETRVFDSNRSVRKKEGSAIPKNPPND
jgi:hypothetical protein